MVWAKVVNDEIMQVHDEDPADLWHPEALEFWQEVPDECFIGWKFKNGKWISGAQWLDEDAIENPPVKPGPPGSTWDCELIRNSGNGLVYKLLAEPKGDHVESFKWIIDGVEYTDEVLELEFEFKDQEYRPDIILEVVAGEYVVQSTIEGMLIPKKPAILT